MKWTYLAPLLVLAFPGTAIAEKLTFDHRTYPPLAAVLDSGRTEMIRFNDSNPKYVTDRIAVQGTSVDHWTEALDIIVRLRKKNMNSASDWAGEIQQAATRLCPSTFTTIAQDETSLTFERKSSGCPAGTPLTGLYRIVAGRKSMYMLNSLAMGEMSASARQQWLNLFATAHLDN
ncbi:MAG: hypothetical protein ABIM50_14115 [Novosphingobium sp.]